jgi:D-tyrosyl-tRNA(Tyr) deacylase
MRVLLQRVSRASVTADGQVIGAIGRGYVLLVGVTHQDTAAAARWLAEKVAGLRLFEDESGKMNLSLSEVGGAILVVSQFTLYADVRKGRRPSFTDAAMPETAGRLVAYFIEELVRLGFQVETGRFGAMMEVEIHNDGPVTLMLERELGGT